MKQKNSDASDQTKLSAVAKSKSGKKRTGSLKRSTDPNKVGAGEDSKELYTIGQITEMFDLTPRTLRYYESEGFFKPIRKGNSRLYTRKNKTRIMLMMRGKRLGFSLKEIKRIFDFYDKSKSSAGQLDYLKKLVLEKLDIIEKQKEDIIMAERELRNTLDLIHENENAAK